MCRFVLRRLPEKFSLCACLSASLRQNFARELFITKETWEAEIRSDKEMASL
jgi:hypothetical protein